MKKIADRQCAPGACFGRLGVRVGPGLFYAPGDYVSPN